MLHLLKYMYVCMCACTRVHTSPRMSECMCIMYMQELTEVRRGDRCPETGIKDGSESPCLVGTEPSPPQVHPVLLTIEPSLQPWCILNI